MMSMSVTNLSSSATSATDRVAKVGDLRKHADALKQQLKQAKTPGTTPADKTKANSLSQEIINIQSQIDRLILEGQLSKLTTGGVERLTSGDTPPTDTSGSSSAQDSERVSQAGGAKRGQTQDPDADPRQDQAAPGRLSPAQVEATREARRPEAYGLTPNRGQGPSQPQASSPWQAQGLAPMQEGRRSSPYQADLEQGMLIDIKA